MSPVLRCAAILFDLDGVLVDSRAVVERTWHRWAALRGIRTSDLVERAHGRRSTDTVRDVAPHLDPEEEVRWLAAAELSDLEGVRALPGAASALVALEEGEWAVVTSGGRELARRRLAHAQLPVPTVLVAAEDVLRGKPAPDGYRMAAERLGVDPAQCVAIEDTPAGIQSARLAPARVMALTTTFPGPALAAADVVANTLADVEIQRAKAGLLLQVTCCLTGTAPDGRVGDARRADLWQEQSRRPLRRPLGIARSRMPVVRPHGGPSTGGMMSPKRSQAFLLNSAALWLLGFVFLLVGVFSRARSGVDEDFTSWGRLHDMAAALASLSLAAAAWGLRDAAIRNGGTVGSGIAWLGAASGIATAILLVLIFLTGASGMLYMLPQAGIGLWLIALCARKPVGFGTASLVLGYVVGAGLLLVAISFVMIATALGPALWAVADAGSITVTPADVASPLNSRGHKILPVGTLLGVLPYPVWASLAARALRRLPMAGTSH